MTKEITLKFIDNQSHGYIQISKYDLQGLDIDIKEFSKYSYYNDNNACYYFEVDFNLFFFIAPNRLAVEDCDGYKLDKILKSKGYSINYKTNHVALNYMNDPIFKRINA